MPVPTCATNVWLSTNTTGEDTEDTESSHEITKQRVLMTLFIAYHVILNSCLNFQCHYLLHLSLLALNPHDTCGTCSAPWSNCAVWVCKKPEGLEGDIRVCLWLCVPLKHLFIESLFFGLIFNVFLSRCAEISLSRLATVALTACGWRQTQLSGKQPFTVTSLQSGLPTIQVFRGNSMKELTIW